MRLLGYVDSLVGGGVVLRSHRAVLSLPCRHQEGYRRRRCARAWSCLHRILYRCPRTFIGLRMAHFRPRQNGRHPRCSGPSSSRPPRKVLLDATEAVLLSRLLVRSQAVLPLRRLARSGGGLESAGEGVPTARVSEARRARAIERCTWAQCRGETRASSARGGLLEVSFPVRRTRL